MCNALAKCIAPLGVDMPTKRPPFLANNFYHFFNRGSHRMPIFREADNYCYVIQKMEKYCRALNLTAIAYCLLPNHYHFLIRQEGEHPARLLPQRVFNSYTKAYNKRYHHSGTLFEGNYKVIHIETDEHLLHLCRYIHANPVIHGIVTDVATWPYSNYQEWVGLRSGSVVDFDFIREHFDSSTRYQAFLQNYLETRSLPEDLIKLLVPWEM
jgi:putative transposase